MSSLPKVLIVGGPDVDTRLDLMHHLTSNFKIRAVGSLPSLSSKFKKEGFSYNNYHLNRETNPVSDFKTVRELIKIFKQTKPHIVHTFDTKPGVWARLAAQVAGVPVIIGTIPGLGSLYSNNSLKTRLIRPIYQRLQKTACHFSDLTIFQNHSDARQFIDANVVSPQKAKVILGSGVSTGTFSIANVAEKTREKTRRELNIRPGEAVVTMISRVIRTKGVLEYMAAVKNIRKSFPKTHFLLIGAADEENVDRLNTTETTTLKQTVNWPGARSDIREILAISDIFVLPSAYREGIPRVLLEAASMGLPIVTTDSPGCNEVVEENVNGYFVQPKDAPALAQRIIQLLAEPNLRHSFGAASRQKAVAQFDLSVVANHTQNIYQEMLEKL